MLSLSAGDYLVSYASSIGKPFVFVSINYRLGYFGFLSSAELAADAKSHGETRWTNQGLHDQRVALRWVRTSSPACTATNHLTTIPDSKQRIPFRW